MPTNPRPEDRLIDLFLSAYDDYTWKSCKIDRLDQRLDGAVEVLATRASDGLTLAIEHTLVQPYDKYSRDFAWHGVFLPIEQDRTLIPRGRSVRVFVSAGALKPGDDWKLVAQTVHEWMRDHALALPTGESPHTVPIPGSSACRLLIRVVEIPNFEGQLQFGIDGSGLPADSLAVVVDKALTTKLPKLVKTIADRKILMLERGEWTLSVDLIAGEIERRGSSLPQLDQIHEIWFADTAVYDRTDCVSFSMRKDGRPAKFLSFLEGSVHERFDE
jgi:hypothetical protein